jgi:hypothetical protein
VSFYVAPNPKNYDIYKTLSFYVALVVGFLNH